MTKKRLISFILTLTVLLSVLVVPIAATGDESSSEIEEVTESAKPADTEKSGESEDAEKSGESANTEKTEDSEEPSGIEKLAETAKTEGVEKIKEAAESKKAAKEESNSAPETTAAPKATDKPDNTDTPADTAKTTKTSKTADTKEPEKTEDDEAAASEKEKTELHISTVEELKDLAKQCRLDTYSENLDVYLDKSIDMTGEGFVQIPYFNGSFNGNGNTIRGISLTVTGDSNGLFRKLGADGVVMDLKLSGRINAQEGSKSTGSVAGTNYGIILNCSFSGTMNGDSEVGGICGFNEGYLMNCECRGKISGKRMTGGICGHNLGNVIGCINRAEVNTAIRESEKKTVDFSVEKLLGLVSIENEDTTVDTGGVVGFSERLLLSCENYGNVGCPTYGYNVGGIAGRQSNCMEKCINHGAVYGRNDVGGIVGHNEPYLLIQDSRTLADEINALSEAFNTAMDNLNANGNATAAYIIATGDSFRDMGKQYDKTVDDAGYYDELETEARRAGVDLDFEGSIFDNTIAEYDPLKVLKILSSELASASNSKRDITGDDVRAIISAADNNGDKANGVFDTMEETADILGIENDISSEDLKTTKDKMSEFDKDLKIDRAEDSINAVREIIDPDGKDIDLDEDDGDAIEEIITGENQIISDNMKGKVTDSVDLISAARAERKEEKRQHQETIDDDAVNIKSSTDNLEDSISGVGDAVDKGAADMSADMSVYNEHMTNALTMISNALAGNMSTKLYNDISELNTKGISDGKILDCENMGPVEGETNVGGIAGCMSIESEHDLEGVVSDAVAAAGIFSNIYMTTCIIESSINRAEVVATKSNCGGIVGNQNIGYLYNDESYGNVRADERYAGGVAGKSDAIIDTCYSNCDICGDAYVGGIVGLGNIILDCISLSTIPESVTTFRGAVAGQVDVKATRVIDLKTGLLADTAKAIIADTIKGNKKLQESVEEYEEPCVLGNFFVDSELGGVNGISYQGVAEPVSYETVMLYAELPDGLKSNTIVFRADGITVKELEIPYGTAISSSQIPAVPEKEGFTGVWSGFDEKTLKTGGIINAIYLPRLSTVESEERREDTGLSTVLLLGNFPEGSSVKADKSEYTSINGKEVVESWTVAPEGEGVDTSYTVRFITPAGAKHLRLYVNQNGTWEKTKYEKVGSYISFAGSPVETEFAVVQDSSYLLIIAASIVAAAALGTGLYIFFHGRKKEES